jgi:CheY-like chemotaxis protein
VGEDRPQLLSNALKFTFDGHIAVSLGEKDGQAVLRVTDTGSGIPPAELPRLFDRFYRTRNARARSNEGSGIGLALVRELVGLHRGTISVESTEHEGTAFTVRLPFGHPEARALAAETTARESSGDGSAVLLSADPYVQEAMRWLPPLGDGNPEDAETAASVIVPGPVLATAAPDAPRVLLADDNADMREYLRRLLAPGYRVTTVTDGQAALDAVRARPPDLVISDVMMPRLDGLGLVSALRADPRTADVPVLLLSARAGQEAAIEGLDAGADDYLVKPFSAADHRRAERQAGRRNAARRDRGALRHPAGQRARRARTGAEPRREHGRCLARSARGAAPAVARPAGRRGQLDGRGRAVGDGERPRRQLAHAARHGAGDAHPAARAAAADA